MTSEALTDSIDSSTGMTGIVPRLSSPPSTHLPILLGRKRVNVVAAVRTLDHTHIGHVIDEVFLLLAVCILAAHSVAERVQCYIHVRLQYPTPP